MTLETIQQAIRKTFTLRVVDTTGGWSADIDETRSGGYESEAKAPREFMVGLADLIGVDPVVVKMEIDAEEEEYQNHLLNFHSRINIIYGAISSGQKDLLTEKDRRWAVKLSICLNHLHLTAPEPSQLYRYE